jgi:hypothetical protein
MVTQNTIEKREMRAAEIMFDAITRAARKITDSADERDDYMLMTLDAMHRGSAAWVHSMLSHGLLPKARSGREARAVVEIAEYSNSASKKCQDAMVVNVINDWNAWSAAHESSETPNDTNGGLR